MYERLTNKDVTPSMDEFIKHIGACKELFENVHSYLTDELCSEIKITFSRDSSLGAWGANYKRKAKYLCTIIAEKNAFLVVMRLTDDQIKTAYDEVLPYTQNCMNNYQRTSNGGWVQYRVISIEQLNDVKNILNIRQK